MQRTLLIALIAALGLACGGEAPEEAGTRIAFKAHNLMCDIPGCSMLPEGVPCVRAKLEASGVPGVCLLEVDRDRNVSGVCRTPAQEIRDFRLEYYTYIGTSELQLAVVLARLDLREETRRSIDLEFPQSRVDTSIDDDRDGRSNLQEFCEGTNPNEAD